MNLTLPGDLIWTVPVTSLEEQLPQPTRAPRQPIPILKYVYRAQYPPPMTRTVWMCVRAVA